MKYANIKDTGQSNVNIGDYLQFMVVEHLLRTMNIPEHDTLYLGVQDVVRYDGEEVILPLCYSIGDFVSRGRIAISGKIRPVFFALTLSTVNKFIDLDQFLNDSYNLAYLQKYAPIGCRDEFTYQALSRHNIPAYINGCMTAIFPRYTGTPGQQVLFVDAPENLLPYIPNDLFQNCVFSTQQYHFERSEISNYRKVFAFVAGKYHYYMQTASLAVTSRLHVALPLTAFGIPVILAKDKVDNRFSFIEKYLPIYGKERYQEIDWSPNVPDFEKTKKLLISHAVGRLTGCVDETELNRMEQELTKGFLSRKVERIYHPSHAVTHENGSRFDEFAAKYWKADAPIKYAFWGINENNTEFWKNHIKTNYPNAELVTVFDSFRDKPILGFPCQRPEQIPEYPELCVIVCSVGAAQAARHLFREWRFPPERFCIAADCFISKDDIGERRGIRD